MRPRDLAIALALSAFLTSATGVAHAADLTEQQAVEAVERFIAAWNSRSPEAFAATLHYPHVRPTAGGGDRVFESAAEYASSIDFDRVLATGWDHSRYDSIRVVHLGQDKAHVAGRYTRYRADGSPIWSNQVTYIVTKTAEGRVGIQARFAAGLVLDDEVERRKSSEAAVRAVEEYMAAFNQRDEDAWAATLHYPHVRVASGAVREWHSATEYTETFDFTTFAARFGWDHSAWQAMEVVQVSTAGVNVALTFSRYDAKGQRLSTFHTLYLVTAQNGAWGIRARSSFAP